MSNTDIVSTAEAAEILDVTVATVNRWAADGRLPTARRLAGTTGARLYLRSVVEGLAAEIAAKRCPTCGHRLDPPAPADEPNGAVA